MANTFWLKMAKEESTHCYNSFEWNNNNNNDYNSNHDFQPISFPYSLSRSLSLSLKKLSVYYCDLGWNYKN